MERPKAYKIYWQWDNLPKKLQVRYTHPERADAHMRRTASTKYDDKRVILREETVIPAKNSWEKDFNLLSKVVFTVNKRTCTCTCEQVY